MISGIMQQMHDAVGMVRKIRGIAEFFSACLQNTVEYCKIVTLSTDNHVVGVKVFKCEGEKSWKEFGL